MNILFDLDGTLTDSYPGIVNSFCHTMSAMGRPAPAPSVLQSLIGPPLREGLALLLKTSDPQAVETAVSRYREYFSKTGMYENTVYPDVPDVLETLRERGARMWVVTSKTDLFARRIVSHFGLEPFFDGITGSAADGGLSAKGDLIAGVMARNALAPGNTVMIGDRKHDIIGARENGIPTIGVLWGYGDAAELSDAGATALCRMPAQLPAAIHAIIDTV